MNRALRFTLLGLAVVVVLFAVTWISLPSGNTSQVAPPASFFIEGLGFGGYVCPENRGLGADGRSCYGNNVAPIPATKGRFLPASAVDDLKARVVVFYGSAAAVIVLVGLALGAGRRPPSSTP